MKTAAYVSFGFFGVLLLAMLTLFGLGIWESDARYVGLAGLTFFGALLALFTGAFFASRAGLGVKK
jgi:hypothetical protein